MVPMKIEIAISQEQSIKIIMGGALETSRAKLRLLILGLASPISR
jgi:hypothetical protein